MRRRLAISVGAVTAALCCQALLSAGGAVAAGLSASDHWQPARELPGIVQLGAGGNAALDAVSCTSPGTCAAGGQFTDGSGNVQAMVASEHNGHWGKPIEVPGTAPLNAAGYAETLAVSCTSTGDCAAGGIYYQTFTAQQAFVVSEKNGHWGKAIEVPGTGTLNAGGYAGVSSVSCGSAGNCAAVGYYDDKNGDYQQFVVSDVSGSWRNAIEPRGLSALNQGGSAGLTAVSCPSAGNCTAVGHYRDASLHDQAAVVSEVHGHWGTAGQVPGTAALNKGGDAGLAAVSCSSAGNCGAGGVFRDASGSEQALVVTERNGHWIKAIELPHSGVLNQGGDAQVTSMSCTATGSCSAGGQYRPSKPTMQSLVATEKNGHWSHAMEVPRYGGLNEDGDGTVNWVSCTSPGNCGAGGDYKDSEGHTQAFVVSERNGTWADAIETPGTATLNTGGSATLSAGSCTGSTYCLAVGSYTDSADKSQALIAIRS